MWKIKTNDMEEEQKIAKFSDVMKTINKDLVAIWRDDKCFREYSVVVQREKPKYFDDTEAVPEESETEEPETEESAEK